MLFTGLGTLQNDNAHTIGILTAKGGTAIHEAHLQSGQSFLGYYTIFLTASVVPPVAGNIRIDLKGPAPVDYSITSRYPPLISLTNRFHPWYSFQDGMLKGILPGDALALTVRMLPPPKLGRYDLILSDAKSQRVYLTMPITFSPEPGQSEDEPCH
ncbi:MAG: hypothetical protein HZB51_24595 [Chloroflexi bacterium]|nr:hypothetical protein [Chloroflexota bacterium]